MMHILITGGAGYIGSHFVRLLKERNYNVLVIDNFSRGHREAIPAGINFEKIDLADFEALKQFIDKYDIDTVVHFAALAYVGESVENPGLYYKNNLVGSVNLLNVCIEKGIKKFIFSSTCSVYGDPDQIPVSESAPLNPINPYARTKAAVERLLEDFEEAYQLKYISLRYFNAAGTHSSGEIGHSHSPETRLIPIVIKTAIDEFDELEVFGDDYDTPDGTCIRDYIHVEDLAEAHLAALEYLNDTLQSDVFNLGTGKGYSVKEIIESVEEITGKKVNYKIEERRRGDPAILVADNRKAADILKWKAERDLNEIIKNAYEWIKNPRY